MARVFPNKGENFSFADPTASKKGSTSVGGHLWRPSNRCGSRSEAAILPSGREVASVISCRFIGCIPDSSHRSGQATTHKEPSQEDTPNTSLDLTGSDKEVPGFQDVKRFPTPQPYTHSRGAVIWVKLMMFVSCYRVIFDFFHFGT